MWNNYVKSIPKAGDIFFCRHDCSECVKSAQVTQNASPDYIMQYFNEGEYSFGLVCMYFYYNLDK